MQKQLGIAVVGCGHWGVNYLRVFEELDESRVIAACDARADRLETVAQRFPNVQLTTSLDDLIGLAEVDAVVVATTASTHFRVTSRCLEAGKHALVEKPLTTVSADASILAALAEARALTLMTGHTFVYNNGIRRVKQYLDDGTDNVYYLYARRTNLGPIRHDVNALWDLASHDIAIFNYLLGRPPTWVSAVGAKVLSNGREDVGFLALGYGDNVIGHIHVSWADPHKTREVVVVGSDRRIVFNDMNGIEQVRVFEKGVRPSRREALNYGEYQFQIRDGDIVSPRIDVVEPLKSQCKHFVECVSHHRRPLTGVSEGRAVVQALEAADRSIALNGTPVDMVTQAPLSRETADRHNPRNATTTNGHHADSGNGRHVDVAEVAADAFHDDLDRVLDEARRILATQKDRRRSAAHTDPGQPRRLSSPFEGRESTSADTPLANWPLMDVPGNGRLHDLDGRQDARMALGRSDRRRLDRRRGAPPRGGAAA